MQRRDRNALSVTGLGSQYILFPGCAISHFYQKWTMKTLSSNINSRYSPIFRETYTYVG